MIIICRNAYHFAILIWLTKAEISDISDKGKEEWRRASSGQCHAGARRNFPPVAAVVMAVPAISASPRARSRPVSLSAERGSLPGFTGAARSPRIVSHGARWRENTRPFGRMDFDSRDSVSQTGRTGRVS